jgi:hypothetical protein
MLRIMQTTLIYPSVRQREYGLIAESGVHQFPPGLPARSICRLQVLLSAVPPGDDATLLAALPAKVRTKETFDDLREGSAADRRFPARTA